MAVIVNTNVQSLVSQRNLSSATNGLNKSTQRLSTGKRINSAADDAAGLFVAKGLESQLSGSQQCQTNIALGINVLQIAEGDLVNIQDNVQRIKDLATQAASGIYSEQARSAMNDEIDARMGEIDRIANSSNFNGINLLNGNAALDSGLTIQVGAGATANDSINITGVFGAATSEGLGLSGLKVSVEYKEATPTTKEDDPITDKFVKWDATNKRYVQATDQTAAGKASLTVYTPDAAKAVIAKCETVMDTITTRRSKLGVAQARLESGSAGLATTIENLSAAKSTIMDTDIAAETSNYTKQQILQQISSSVLTQANQAPSIALTLMS